jgi:hypothetical protein
MLSYNVAHRRVLAGRSGVEYVSDIVVEKTEPPGNRMILSYTILRKNLQYGSSRANNNL